MNKIDLEEITKVLKQQNLFKGLLSKGVCYIASKFPEASLWVLYFDFTFIDGKFVPIYVGIGDEHRSKECQRKKAGYNSKWIEKRKEYGLNRIFIASGNSKPKLELLENKFIVV